MRFRSFSQVFVSILFFLSLCSCVQAKESQGQSRFGDDSYYFLGLRAKNEGNIDEAKNYFNRCIKKGSSLFVKRSLEEFCSSEDIQERISAAKQLVANYDDEKAILTAAKVFSEHNEPNLLISATQKIDLKTSDNELIKLRFEALKKRGDVDFREDLFYWFFSRPMDAKQYDFFQQNFVTEAEQVLLKDEFADLWEKKLYLMNFRAEIYKRDYYIAKTRLPLIQKIIDESNALNFDSPENFSAGLMTEQLMSDIGKAYLYGNADPLESARYFQTEAEKYKGTPIEFYCWFYAGRLYDKAGNYVTLMEKSFVSAMECTSNTSLKDNALWYLFRTSLKSSVSASIANIEKYVTQITDPYYYDDFFDLFSQLLLTERKYMEIGKLYKLMDGYASKESTAKYAYIYARLLEEGIYLPTDADLADGLPAGGFIETEIQCAYNTALNSATDMYYKLMAAERLGLPESERIKLLCEPRKIGKSVSETNGQKGNQPFSDTGSLGAIINPEVEQLLNGYAFFGFPEKIYPEWVKLGSPVLSIETTINLCKLLQNCSTGEDDYLMQSLRIASKTANYFSLPLTRELLEYVYPKNYEEFVTKYCDKYQLKKSTMWALIRSESFFDPDIRSSAGAVGLCQLMPFTGEDIAQRLKKSDYDLTDPETSIEFGAYYLDNLIGRLDGSYLDAFFSYNAGIGRVRRWKKSLSFGAGLNDIPEDLFLEMIPYTETREYGRKLVAATEMYEWLWYR